jgi:parvulin-like peptidyl-prolyl isomerase
MKSLSSQLITITMLLALTLLPMPVAAQSSGSSNLLDSIKKRQREASRREPGVRVKTKDDPKPEEQEEESSEQENANIAEGVVIGDAKPALAGVVFPYAISLDTVQKRAEAQLGKPPETWHEEEYHKHLRRAEDSILYEWAANALLADLARKAGMKVEPTEMSARLVELADAAGHPGDPTAALANFGIDIRSYLPELENSILTEKYIFRIIENSISEADMRKLYEGNKNQFYQPAQVRLRAIVKDLAAAPTDQQLIKAVEEMERAEKQIKRGADFAEIARDTSDAKASASRGGDMGWLGPGNMLAAPYNEAIFNYVVGRPTGIVQSEDGRFLYIFKVEEKRPEVIHPFEKVQRQLKLLIYDEFRDRLYNRERKNYTVYLNSGGIPESFEEKIDLEALVIY